MTDAELPRRNAQPPPKVGKTRIWPIVFDYLFNRVVAGRGKYERFLETFNGRNALVDLRDELADALMYITQAIEEQADKDAKMLAMARELKAIEEAHCCVESTVLKIAEEIEANANSKHI